MIFIQFNEVAIVVLVRKFEILMCVLFDIRARVIFIHFN